MLEISNQNAAFNQKQFALVFFPHGNGRECAQKWNIPEDITATINMINSLKGSVSDATLLSQLPFITDVNAELEAVAEQKAANMAIYNFGATGADDEEEDEAV